MERRPATIRGTRPASNGKRRRPRRRKTLKRHRSLLGNRTTTPPDRKRRSRKLPENSNALAHQFDDIEQQHESASLGMWIFLATEVMFFGGMFLGYAVYRSAYSAAYAEASRHLDVLLGGINTAVLLCSSLTMALAVHAAQLGVRRTVAVFLVATIVLGSVFLGIKSLEYYNKYEEHFVPGPQFQFPGPNGGHAQIFFSFYFVMTAMHALHM